MSYTKRLAERLDDIIAEPNQPHAELREKLLRFLLAEVYRSYWNGVKRATEGTARARVERQHADDEVTVSKLP